MGPYDDASALRKPCAVKNYARLACANPSQRNTPSVLARFLMRRFTIRMAGRAGERSMTPVAAAAAVAAAASSGGNALLPQNRCRISDMIKEEKKTTENGNLITTYIIRVDGSIIINYHVHSSCQTIAIRSSEIRCPLSQTITTPG